MAKLRLSDIVSLKTDEFIILFAFAAVPLGAARSEERGALSGTFDYWQRWTLIATKLGNNSSCNGTPHTETLETQYFCDKLSENSSIYRWLLLREDISKGVATYSSTEARILLKIRWTCRRLISARARGMASRAMWPLLSFCNTCRAAWYTNCEGTCHNWNNTDWYYFNIDIWAVHHSLGISDEVPEYNWNSKKEESLL